jgi:hypothetical protein
VLLQSQISLVLLPLLLLETKGRPKKWFDGGRDLNITPSVLAFIPPKREGKGDCIFNNRYFNPAPFATSLKVIGYRFIFICDFICLKLYSALKGGKLLI